VKRGVVLIAVVAAVAIPAAAAPAAQRPASLRADIAEWSVVPSVGVVHSGLVRITVRNVGVDSHQLMVVRTSQFAEDLPLAGSRAVARPVAEPIVVAPGKGASVVVNLRPGNYLLIDNLPWHYWHGTVAAFAVR
jgi:uncharacterized cupredoxin-like copper-binding protein